MTCPSTVEKLLYFTPLTYTCTHTHYHQIHYSVQHDMQTCVWVGVRSGFADTTFGESSVFESWKQLICWVWRVFIFRK